MNVENDNIATAVRQEENEEEEDRIASMSLMAAVERSRAEIRNVSSASSSSSSYSSQINPVALAAGTKETGTFRIDQSTYKSSAISSYEDSELASNRVDTEDEDDHDDDDGMSSSFQVKTSTLRSMIPSHRFDGIENDIEIESADVETESAVHEQELVRAEEGYPFFFDTQTVEAKQVEVEDEWEPVYQRIISHPEEIREAGNGVSVGGMNSLHAACLRYPPPRIIKTMLQVDVDAAMKQNANGETPLHVASYSSNEEIQEILIAAKPEACTLQDKYGDTPLHYAARAGATPYLMEVFLQAYPQAICIENNRKATPFWLLPRAYLQINSLEDILQGQGREDEGDDEDESSESGEYLDDWEMLVLFLRYSYFGKTAKQITPEQMHSYEKWMVHAAAACPACPRDVLKFLCRLFPSQTVKYNQDGFTPLLLAIRAEERSDPIDWDDIDDGFRAPVPIPTMDLRAEEEYSVAESILAVRDGDSDFVQRVIADHIADEDDEDEFNETAIDVLLDWSPRSVCVVDRNGRLPLSHALEQRKSWKSIRAIVRACPRAVECRDMSTGTGFYMFEVAAMHSPDLDTIYALARSTPYLIATRSTTSQRFGGIDTPTITPSNKRLHMSQERIEPSSKKIRLS